MFHINSKNKTTQFFLKNPLKLHYSLPNLSYPTLNPMKNREIPIHSTKNQRNRNVPREQDLIFPNQPETASHNHKQSDNRQRDPHQRLRHCRRLQAQLKLNSFVFLPLSPQIPNCLSLNPALSPKTIKRTKEKEEAVERDSEKKSALSILERERDEGRVQKTITLPPFYRKR